MIINNEIRERFDILRKELNITYGEMSKVLGYSNGNGLSMILNFKNPLTEVHLKILKFTYNVNSTWLLEGTGTIFIDKLHDSIGGIEPEENLSINQSTRELMTPERFDRLLTIIELQREDVRYALENQRMLIKKVPDFPENLGEQNKNRAATN